jgi:DNA helicase HerA-like ATPase
LYSKLFFEYVTSLSNRGSFPINIILEEAHRYVNDDKDRIVLGYNIFDRITKEGRKYGLLMGFITQRPSELSQTSLSQCSNFLVFRLFHPEDYNMIDRITNGLTNDSLDRLKNLRNGVALAFGNAFSVPFLVSIDLPDPLPLSNNVKISNTWYN